jgi:hypothetical protein
MKIVREMFNKTRDQWEFLTDDGHMLVQGALADDHFTWTLYQVATQDVLDENWNGYEVWQRSLKYGIEPDQVLARYEREQKSQYSCELFADLDAETKGELDLAYHHIEAGDLTGAFQHLIQFATWAMQEYTDIPMVGEVWEHFGPHYGRNHHLHIIYNEELGWQLWDKLNESFYGPLCPDCHRPVSQCCCPPEETQRCEHCHYLIDECHCNIQIPF